METPREHQLDVTYRYPQFHRALLKEDSAFERGVRPGAMFPDFTLTDIVGNKIRRDDLLGKPVLLVAASVTCPMTASAMPILHRFHREYGEKVRFVTLYVREAHPGESFPQPEKMTEKRLHARELRERDLISWQMLVDDIDGTVHHALDNKPSAAVFLDADGTVVYRSLWSNDRRALQRGFDTLFDHSASPDERQSHFVPMLSGLGSMHEVLDEAGPQAKRDVMREAAPMYALARVAGLFRPLPPLGRGIAASVATAGVGLLFAMGVKKLLGRGRSRRTGPPVTP